MAGADAKLEVKDLSAAYGRVPVLHGANLSVDAGEAVGILGHNGMGKTTLLKTIMGFLKPTRGSVVFDDREITRFEPHRCAELGLGYVPQGRGIFPALSVLENLHFASGLSRDDTSQDAVDRILTEFPRLRPLLDRQGGALSGGEQQLLALARALMAEPDLLLLDEPTEGIQPSIIDEIADTLSRLKAQRGLSLLVTEQNFDFLADISDRMLIFEKGQVIAALRQDEFGNSERINAFLGLGNGHHTPARSSPYDIQSSLHVPARAGSPGKPDARAAIEVIAMTVKRPTLDQMKSMAGRFGLAASELELAQYLEIMKPYFDGYDLIDTLPDHLPEVRYPRAPGYRPSPSENALNAWYMKTDIRGAQTGPLAGKRIAVKDTITVAGVPMMNGSSIMEGYTPEIDATVVTRILDAGGIIAGKTTCENLCLSGGSHTTATGPVHNPYKRGYMAGGSSSGSGVLVATGEVDMAIGGDQGGSIRIPASNCGCYGMKPSHGLVPYSGAMPIEQTIDHLGPMTRSVADNALLLEVIAGEDGLDPRQYAPKSVRYTEAIGRGVKGLRIGLLKEGFARPESEPDVDAKVRAAGDRLHGLGAEVSEISIPEHMQAPALWTAIAVEGLQSAMMRENSMGSNHRGLYLPSMSDHFAQWRNRANELSPSLLTCMFLGDFFHHQYRGRYYGKAQNIMRRVTGKYLEGLTRVDLLLMPTLPMKAQPIPPANAPLSLYVQRAFEMVGNTAPFNASGLPAMSVPCGMAEGLPIGMMLVGRRYDEFTIYRAADAFERSGDSAQLLERHLI